MQKHLFLGAALGALLAGSLAASAQEKLGDGMVMYFQMGGTPGGGATLPRTNGAKAAAEAFGVDLREQYSSWHPETMLDQFREAMAATPDCIEIMGHPGEDAWEPLVAQAREQGIIVTSGNASIPRLYEQYQTKGFGYVGVELFAGGYLTGQMMMEHGDLQSGDKAVVYGHFTSGRRQSADGVVAALKEGGLEVDELVISAEVDADFSQAVPVIVAYLDFEPGREGDRHAARWHHQRLCPGPAGRRQAAGRHCRGRHRPRARDHRRPVGWLRHGDPGSAAVLSGLPAGGAVRALEKIWSHRLLGEHRRRGGHAGKHQGAGAADRGRHPLGFSGAGGAPPAPTRLRRSW